LSGAAHQKKLRPTGTVRVVQPGDLYIESIGIHLEDARCPGIHAHERKYTAAASRLLEAESW
jgi:hypothetical protein